MTRTHSLRRHVAARRQGEALRVLAAVVVLCTVALAAIVHLERNAQADSHAQLRLAGVARQLDALETAPFRARPGTGGSPAMARRLLTYGERRVRRAQDGLEDAAPPNALIRLPRLTHEYFGTLEAIYRVGISPAGYGAQADHLSGLGRAARTPERGDRRVRSGLRCPGPDSRGRHAARHCRGHPGALLRIRLLPPPLGDGTP
ncbi:MAG TPA: hypothetical protein VGL44_17000 [Gaiellales bacterium]